MKDNLIGVSLLTLSITIFFLALEPVSVVTTYGDSMQPTLDNDEIITVNIGLQPGEGDIIYFSQDGIEVVHRTVVYVDEGDDWTSEVSESKIKSTNCSELNACPAPRSGWITDGDNNKYVDQSLNSNPDKPVTEDEITGVVIIVLE